MKNALEGLTHKATAEGVISISSRGIGYVAVGGEKNKGEDPEIDFGHLNTALHGDLVKIFLHKKSNSRQTGEVVKIISRAKTSFVGILETSPGLSATLSLTRRGAGGEVYFLKPDDPKMYANIVIPKNFLNGAKAGQKVFAEIVSWKNTEKSPIGKVIKILGKPGNNDTEMHAIAIEKGFDSELSCKAEEEAKKIKQNGITQKDYLDRRDFRQTLTFTIDPSDAKDFDDALSFKEINNNEYEIGIHIADVSHYVKVGSALDVEARERGTSVYLVDRTIPMLPEALSNDLCSLLPHKDRLTMSAVFTIDKNAKIKSEWFGRSVIHSNKRFTYEEAEETIKKSTAALHKELFILNNLAKKLTKERMAEGAMSLEQEEVKFVLDDKGVPIKIIKKERGDSNKLVEEFMLLANKKVAELLSNKKDKNRVSIYRVHDLPSKEKMADLAFFLRSLGYPVSLQNGIIPTNELNKLLTSGGKKEMEDTVHRAIIRSMAKAVYSTKNIGHYGLAFQYYTHFTSPIRRYPDIMIHRLLNDYLSKNKTSSTFPKTGLLPKEKLIEYEKITLKASEQEKRASDAERASIKYKQVEYMSKRLGKIFDGIISGMTEWGMYVEEKETKCEGMIRVRDMKDDYYIFDEKKLELVGKRKKKKYRLGDHVKIKVKGADMERKTIDYVLI